MSAKTTKYVNLISGIVLSLLTVLVGTLFYCQIIDIYVTGTHTGGNIFSAEIVAEHFARISPAFWLWIAMIIAVYILCEVFPVEKKISPYKDSRYALKRLNKKAAQGVEGQEENYALIKRERLIISVLWAFAAAMILAGVIYGVIYLANRANFPKENIDGEVLSMVKSFLPFICLSFFLCLFAAGYEGISAKKQLPAVKSIVAGSKGRAVAKAGVFAKLRSKINGEKALKVYDFVYAHRINIVRITVAVIAVSFVIVGIFNGSMADVLKKAINICTECIGLG